MTDGNVTDYDVVRKDINDFALKYNIRQLAIDRWNATQLAINLTQDGVDVVGFSQGIASISGPSKLLENYIVSGRLRHGGNKILTWMASNVEVKTDANGNIKPNKPKQGSSERIDGIISLIMAVGVHAAQKPTEQAPEPGIMIL